MYLHALAQEIKMPDFSLFISSLFFFFFLSFFFLLNLFIYLFYFIFFLDRAVE